MNPTLIHAFAISEGQANQIVDSLGKSGFSSNDISVIFPDKDTSRELTTEKAMEGGLIGTATGGLLGGILGLLVGIGTLAIPGVEPLLVAAGPLLAALSGAATGATAGGIAGGLIGFKIPEIRAKCHDNRFTDGDILISVLAETGDAVNRARQALQRGL